MKINIPVIFLGRWWCSSGLKFTKVTYCVFFVEKHNHRDLFLWHQQKGTGAGSAELGAYRCRGWCPAEDAQSKHRRSSPQSTRIVQKWQMETCYTTRLLLGWESNILLIHIAEKKKKKSHLANSRTISHLTHYIAHTCLKYWQLSSGQSLKQLRPE